MSSSYTVEGALVRALPGRADRNRAGDFVRPVSRLGTLE